MEFGASIFFTDYSITAAELGVALEERGFDSVWAAEHSHIPVPRRTRADSELGKRYYDVMDPFVTLTAAACATKRLKVATGICLVIQRDTIQTAKLVAKVLKGAQPAKIPIQTPDNLILAINLSTAKAINLEFPLSVLERADRLVE